ncbi:MAG: hypothetical protein V4695_06975 [Pseudomonadota bacterium]
MKARYKTNPVVSSVPATFSVAVSPVPGAVSLNSLPQEIIVHIAESLPARSGDLKHLHTTNRLCRNALQERIVAERLIQESFQPGKATGSDASTALLDIIKVAGALGQRFQADVLCHVAEALARHVGTPGADVGNPLKALCLANHALRDPFQRYRAGEAVSRFFAEKSLQVHVDSFEIHEHERRCLQDAYAFHCQAHIVFLDKMVGRIVAKKNAALGASCCPTWTNARVFAETLGSLAKGMYLTASDTERAFQWQAFFSHPLCIEAEARVHLLEGLADAIEHQPQPDVKRGTFRCLLEEIPKLLPPHQALLVAALGKQVKLLPTALQAAAFTALRSVASNMAGAAEPTCKKAIIELLEFYPMADRQAAFGSFLRFAEIQRTDVRPAMLVSLAEGLQHLPRELRHCAFDDIYRSLRQLAIPLQQAPAAALILGLQTITDGSPFEVRFTQMVQYVTDIAPEARLTLVQNLIQTLSPQENQIASISDFHDVLKLVSKQPVFEQPALLEKIYDKILDFDVGFQFALLESANRVASALAEPRQVCLVGGVVRVAINLPPHYMVVQFERLLRRVEAYDKLYADMACEEIASILEDFVEHMKDDMLEDAEDFLPEGFNGLAQTADVLPHPMRLQLLDMLAEFCGELPEALIPEACAIVQSHLNHLSPTEIAQINRQMPPLA